MEVDVVRLTDVLCLGYAIATSVGIQKRVSRCNLLRDMMISRACITRRNWRIRVIHGRRGRTL